MTRGGSRHFVYSFILANTEQLHAKIIEMSDRIRHLEEALESLQSTCSVEPHPLLRADLLTIKSALGLYGGTQTGAGQIPSPPPEQDSQDHEHVTLSMDIDSHNHPSPGECHEILCHEVSGFVIILMALLFINISIAHPQARSSRRPASA